MNNNIGPKRDLVSLPACATVGRNVPCISHWNQQWFYPVFYQESNPGTDYNTQRNDPGESLCHCPTPGMILLLSNVHRTKCFCISQFKVLQVEQFNLLSTSFLQNSSHFDFCYQTVMTRNNPVRNQEQLYIYFTSIKLRPLSSPAS